MGALPGRVSLVERGYWINDERDIMCHDDEPADGDYTTGVSELCGRDIQGFELTYFDGTQWLEYWEGEPEGEQAGLLPKAIHIVVTIGRQKPYFA